MILGTAGIGKSSMLLYILKVDLYFSDAQNEVCGVLPDPT
jgi:hypothetical protein